MRLLDNWIAPVRAANDSQSVHARLRLGLVADELTRTCLEQVCTTIHLTPQNARRALRQHRPDLVFVESVWSGFDNRWKYKVASYKDHPERDNRDLAKLVEVARDLGIPTVFWNKEDSAHFDRFIDSACLFDHVVTVDASCIPAYRARMPNARSIGVMMFGIEPSIHHFAGLGDRIKRANFVGSYGHHVHPGRRERQDALLRAAAIRLGLTIWDRNSGRKSPDYRFPPLPNTDLRPCVDHQYTAEIFRSHLVSLNVNTVENSETMLSRRLVEIIACGGLAVTTPSLAVERWFAPFCYVARNQEEAEDILGRLAMDGYSAHEVEMMRAGAADVAKHHTWSQRINTLLADLHACT